MSSLFKLNQLSAQPEAVSALEEPITLENQDKEIYALRQQLQTLKTLYKNAKTQTEHPSQKNPIDPPIENEYSKQRIEKLMAVLADREKQMRSMQADAKQQHAQTIEEYQKEKQAKLVAHEEITALHGQLEFLKNKLISSQNVLKTQQEQIQVFVEQRELAATQLSEAAWIAEQKNALQIECERLQNEVFTLTQQLNTTQIASHEKDKSLNVKETQALAFLEKIELLEKDLTEANRRIETMTTEKTLIQENAFKIQSAQEDAEARLKIAHYHLAKKVKETTVLSDRERDLENQVQEMTVDLTHTQEKILELQRLLEEQFFQEKRRQEHLQDSLKDTETLARAWEKKYFELYAKWEAHDVRLKEFKNLEEKLFQMKSLWISFGKFFGEAAPIHSHEVNGEMPYPSLSLLDENAFTTHCDNRQNHSTFSDLVQPAKETSYNVFD